MEANGRCTKWPLNESDYAKVRMLYVILQFYNATEIVCKVGHVTVSVLFPVLLNLKRKQTELLLRHAIIFYFGKSRRFAWSLDTSIHGICASNSRISKKPALEK